MSEKIRFTADEALEIAIRAPHNIKLMKQDYPPRPLAIFASGMVAGMAFAKLDVWGRMEQAIRNARIKYGIHYLSEVALRKIVLGGGK